MSNTYAYALHGGLYLNITNRCTLDCVFCVRHQQGDFCGNSLWLEREPTAADVLQAIQEKGGADKFSEVVFCGFGEPTMGLDTMLEVCRSVKERWHVPIRLNTNGQANLVYGEDITPRFKGLIDTVSVSLNAPDSDEYDATCQPETGGQAFQAMLDFTAACQAQGLEVIMTVVNTIGEEKVAQCRQIADKLGVKFRVRTYIEGK